MIFFKNNKILTVLLLAITIFIYYNFTREVNLDSKADPKSKFYVNDLYSSNGRIYNNYLNEKEQEFYMIMLDDIKNHRVQRNIKYKDFNCDDFYDCAFYPNLIFEVFEAEYPELLSFATLMYVGNKDSFDITYIYATPLKSFDRLGELRIKRIINDIKEKTKNMTDEEKVLYVYDFFGENYSYDRMFTFTGKNQSAFNVFINKNAVCAGFAKASAIIFQNIGIEVYPALGVSTGPHMWNIIKLKDKYYYYDSTVAASIRNKNSSYYYNGLVQSYMNSYLLENAEWYPKVETENYAKIENNKVVFIN